MNTVTSDYINCGGIPVPRQIFDKLEISDMFSWGQWYELSSGLRTSAGTKLTFGHLNVFTPREVRRQFGDNEQRFLFFVVHKLGLNTKNMREAPKTSMNEWGGDDEVRYCQQLERVGQAWTKTRANTPRLLDSATTQLGFFRSQIKKTPTAESVRQRNGHDDSAKRNGHTKHTTPEIESQGETPIESWSLSVETISRLKECDVHTVENLIGMESVDFISFDNNLGEEAVDEVFAVMVEKGLFFADGEEKTLQVMGPIRGAHPKADPDTKRPATTTKEKRRRGKKGDPNNLHSRLGLAYTTIYTLNRCGIKTIQDLEQMTSSKFAGLQENYGEGKRLLHTKTIKGVSLRMTRNGVFFSDGEEATRALTSFGQKSPDKDRAAGATPSGKTNTQSPSLLDQKMSTSTNSPPNEEDTSSLERAVREFVTALSNGHRQIEITIKFS